MVCHVFSINFCDPYGNRTRVSAVKGQRPGPLDERALNVPEHSPVFFGECKCNHVFQIHNTLTQKIENKFEPQDYLLIRLSEDYTLLAWLTCEHADPLFFLGIQRNTTDGCFSQFFNLILCF